MKFCVGLKSRGRIWLVAMALVSASGCAAKRTIAPVAGPLNGIAPEVADARAEMVRKDPRAYLHKVAERCHALEHPSLVSTLQRS